MTVLDKEQFFESLQNHIGTDSSEESIKFMEDMTDTYHHLASNDWQKKYDDVKKEKEELDASWRKKYQHRFFNSPVNNPSNDDVDETENAESVQVMDLFKNK